MIVADYIALFLKNRGVNKVFAIQGGGSARLIDGIGRLDGIEYICNQHEQASAMSADGYARATGHLACAISTSGPGATNLLTGCCGAYFDSIPILFITGQVSSFRLKKNLHVRCMHTQETDVVDIFKPVTKYATALKNPFDIRYELEKCAYIAESGRPGPVLLDIPDDYQRVEIEVDKLKGFCVEEETKNINEILLEERFEIFKSLVSSSKKPVVIAGWGCHVSHSESQFFDFVEKCGMPVVCTWGGNDLLPNNSVYKIGAIGMNGDLAANYAVKEADLLIVLGARLDHHSIVVGLKDFGRNAKKIYIDIDAEEIQKFNELGCNLDLTFNIDICNFLDFVNKSEFVFEKKHQGWIEELFNVKNKNIGGVTVDRPKDSKVNPCFFYTTLSELLEDKALIFADTGSSLVWAEQYFKFKKGQRMHSSFNNTPMGYSLPAAVGGALATGGRVYSINGDGGIQMNLQELATVARHNLDLKIILFDNAGYGMVQRTQDTYLNGRYEGTDVPSGLAFPDFEKLFEVYGFSVVVIESDTECHKKLMNALEINGPGCIIVKVSLNEGYETFKEDYFLS